MFQIAIESGLKCCLILSIYFNTWSDGKNIIVINGQTVLGRPQEDSNILTNIMVHGTLPHYFHISVNRFLSVFACCVDSRRK